MQLFGFDAIFANNLVDAGKGMDRRKCVGHGDGKNRSLG
jgi:hypothetical protein